MLNVPAWTFLCVLAAGAHVPHRDVQDFLESILRFYGENETISKANLEDLLLLISSRRIEANTEENPLETVEVSVFSFQL